MSRTIEGDPTGGAARVRAERPDVEAGPGTHRIPAFPVAWWRAPAPAAGTAHVAVGS